MDPLFLLQPVSANVDSYDVYVVLEGQVVKPYIRMMEWWIFLIRVEICFQVVEEKPYISKTVSFHIVYHDVVFSSYSLFE